MAGEYTLYHPDAIPSPQSAFDDGYRRGYKQALKDFGALMEELADGEDYYTNYRAGRGIRATAAKVLAALHPPSDS